MEIRILNAEDNVLAEIEGDTELNFVFEHEYAYGDKIVVSGCDEKYIWIMFDAAMGKSGSSISFGIWAQS